MTSFTEWVDDPPAEGTWINCATLRDHRFFADLARTNIRLFRDEIPHDTVMRLNLDLEPAPHLDYHLFNVLTCVHWRKIGSRSRELLECIIDARRDYYRSHEQYRRAFCRLQDVGAYGVILEQDRARLINSGTANAKQLEDNAIKIQKNDIELAQVYNITVEKRELRESLTTIFCQTKEFFLENEVPLLVFLGKDLYKRHLEIDNPQGSLQNERQPSAPAHESSPSENHNFVPLVPQEIEPANIVVMNQDPERVSPSTVPSDPQLMEPGPVTMMQKYPEPMHQNTIRYLSLAEQPFDPVQPARQAPVPQEATLRINEPLSSSQAPIQPAQQAPFQQEAAPRIYEPLSSSQAPIQPAPSAPMHQQSTLSPHQTAKFPSYHPSQSSKQHMPKFLNNGPPAPIAAAPELATATPVKEAPPPRSIPRSATVKAPAKELNVIRPSRSIQIAPVAQMQAHSQPFYQPNPAYQETAIAPLHPNAKFAGPLNNPPYLSCPPFPISSQALTPQLSETAPCRLTTMREDRKYAPKHSAVYTTPYVQTLPAPAGPMQTKQHTERRPSIAFSSTISYSRVPAQQEIKISKPVTPAGGFLSRLLEQDMTEQELDEIAARFGPAEQVVEQEASDKLCGDEA